MVSEPLVICTYGWGRWLRLYQDQVDIDGIVYPLCDLTYVQPLYRQIFGISSVRVELHFGESVLLLRGMSLREETQVLVEYLNRWAVANAQCGVHAVWTLPAQSKEAQAQNVLVLPFGQAQRTSFKDRPRGGLRLEIPTWMLLCKEQRERRLKRLQVERSLRMYGFDVARLEQRLREEPLPHVQVPLRLLPGEHAHYSTETVLCADPAYNTVRNRYIVKDQGTLIFTNKRVIYLGRKSQLVISYARLVHVSPLHGALAFLAEHWLKREVFEVPRPLECTMYLEAILHRSPATLPTSAETAQYPPASQMHEAFVAPITSSDITQQVPLEEEITQPLKAVQFSSTASDLSGYWEWSDSETVSNRS